MKRIYSILTASALCLTLASQAFSAPPPGELTKQQWKAFSKNLVVALHTDNDGLKVSAMQQIIAYADHLDVDAAAFEIMKIYREGDSEAVRRMAIVTLGKMENHWAMRFLERSVHFESNPTLKKTIKAVLHEYRQPA